MLQTYNHAPHFPVNPERCRWCRTEPALLVSPREGLCFACLCDVLDQERAAWAEMERECQDAACAEFDALQLARDADLDARWALTEAGRRATEVA